VRYDEPRPFAIVENKLGRACGPKVTGDSVLMDLLDAIVDRSADILERVAAEVDQISHSIFEPDDAKVAQSYNEVLKALGRKGDLTSKVRESQVSVGRLLSFLGHEAEVLKWTKDPRTQIQSMQRDVISLTDHASFLSNKITFLLDAMLGVVNIQQNAIIKIFSIMAVVFMPPTLVASIYGMNFHGGMIELDWEYGYVWALGLMVVVAILPIAFFKWKKWL
jgi:magnesium transporter